MNTDGHICPKMDCESNNHDPCFKIPPACSIHWIQTPHSKNQWAYGPGVVFILLTQGVVTVVDRDDWPKVRGFKWKAHLQKGAQPYACTYVMHNGRRSWPLMHRVLQGSGASMVDHANRNRLDNRAFNLRCCTRTDNARNVVRACRGVYRGVRRSGTGWVSSIGVGNRRLYLGSYGTPHDAACRYDLAARVLHGQFAVTNFSAPFDQIKSPKALLEAPGHIPTPHDDQLARERRL